MRRSHLWMPNSTSHCISCMPCDFSTFTSLVFLVWGSYMPSFHFFSVPSANWPSNTVSWLKFHPYSSLPIEPSSCHFLLFLLPQRTWVLALPIFPSSASTKVSNLPFSSAHLFLASNTTAAYKVASLATVFLPYRLHYAIAKGSFLKCRALLWFKTSHWRRL